MKETRQNPQKTKSNESCLAMKIIAGLGNPGRKYNGTRHNIGWEVLAELARRHGTSKPKVRFRGETVDAMIGTEAVLLLCPITFMNASGESLLPAKNYYRLENQDLLVICDDLNLPVAKLRFRSQGSSGGQKGLQDIIKKLDTTEFSRLRIGIGEVPAERNAASYVLGKFPSEEQDLIQQAIHTAADAVADWTQHGIDYSMNHYNGN